MALLDPLTWVLLLAVLVVALVRIAARRHGKIIVAVYVSAYVAWAVVAWLLVRFFGSHLEVQTTVTETSAIRFAAVPSAYRGLAATIGMVCFTTVDWLLTVGAAVFAVATLREEWQDQRKLGDYLICGAGHLLVLLALAAEAFALNLAVDEVYFGPVWRVKWTPQEVTYRHYWYGLPNGGSLATEGATELQARYEDSWLWGKGSDSPQWRLEAEAPGRTDVDGVKCRRGRADAGFSGSLLGALDLAAKKGGARLRNRTLVRVDPLVAAPQDDRPVAERCAEAEAAKRAGQASEARRLLLEVLDDHPGAPEALYLLAWVEVGLRDAPAASRHFEQFLRVAGPTDPRREEAEKALARLQGAPAG